MTAYALRAAGPDDEAGTYEIHRSAMGDVVAATWGGWDDADQRPRHAEAARTGDWRLIEVAGRPVGVLIVNRSADGIHLARIEILPEWQGHGLGRAIIGELVDEARRRGVPLSLDVLPANVRAERLYRRLGFRETGRDADAVGKIHLRLD